MKKTEIYVGLNDLDTKEQKFETSIYLSLLKKVCINYQVPFSVNVIEGGYVHESGEYTQETTLVLTLFDIKREDIDNIAKDLCAFFHQESVLVATGEVEVYSVSESI
ncbi:MAG: hypothetical protein IKF93_00030 [Lachnospiraceae bacterium]|nr:hypothetical protein [Lachnospiraceae bacterium]